MEIVFRCGEAAGFTPGSEDLAHTVRLHEAYCSVCQVGQGPIMLAADVAE
jgi:hypothetical protein